MSRSSFCSRLNVSSALSSLSAVVFACVLPSKESSNSILRAVACSTNQSAIGRNTLSTIVMGVVWLGLDIVILHVFGLFFFSYGVYGAISRRKCQALFSSNVLMIRGVRRTYLRKA